MPEGLHRSHDTDLYVDIDTDDVTKIPTGKTLQTEDAILYSFEDNIIASTTQTQGEQPLTKELNFVATVANGDDVVTMPPAAPGKKILVANNGANTLQIFPATGDNFQSLGTNASTTIASDQSKIFFTTNSAEWAVIPSI